MKRGDLQRLQVWVSERELQAFDLVVAVHGVTRSKVIRAFMRDVAMSHDLDGPIAPDSDNP